MGTRQATEDVLARNKAAARHGIPKITSVTQVGRARVFDSVAARIAVTANDAQVGVNRVEPIQLSQVGRAPCELAFADIWRVGHGDQYLFGGFGD